MSKRTQIFIIYSLNRDGGKPNHMFKVYWDSCLKLIGSPLVRCIGRGNPQPINYFVGERYRFRYMGHSKGY